MKSYCLFVFLLLIPACLLADDTSLDNGVVSAHWITADGVLGWGEIRDNATGSRIMLGPNQVWLEVEGKRIRGTELTLVGAPVLQPLAVLPKASQASARLPGNELVARYEDAVRHFALIWRAELRDGSRYLRMSVEIDNLGSGDLALTNLGLLQMRLQNASVSGDFSGSPVTAGTVFLGIEHPLAQNNATDGRVDCSLPVLHALHAGESMSASAVIGFTDPGQLRRGFLAYLERERARPYRPFLYYNTWYSIGYQTPFNEADLMGAIRIFGRELVTARRTKMDAFVLDDGWDDPKTLWKFHHGFPTGLRPSRDLAAQFGAKMGIWLSPWGGYGQAKQARLKFGTAEGFETRAGSFSLAGPRYYARFADLCTGVLRDDGVVYFKFDGIGSKTRTGQIDPGDGRDFEAMLRLIHELRSIQPDVFINQTTGTWPSPFWLLQVDSIWRSGQDHDFAGVGTNRQQWMTYRDGQTYRNVVERGPLYPLNSLMVHGIIYATKAKNLATDPGGDFTSEVRTYFGSGTQLQELYVSPELLTAKNWDDLAAAARWSRANAATLSDTHWVGGDPMQLQVYGWAAWSADKGILTLRNPSDKPASFAVDVGKLFELPAGAAQVYSVAGAYADMASPVSSLRAGEPVELKLAPFGVMVLEMTPGK